MWLGYREYQMNRSLEVLAQDQRELEICRDVQKQNFCFFSLIHSKHVQDAYSNLHKEFEALKPFSQLLTPQ